MINEKQIDLLVERLVDRVNKANTYFLKSIGSSIKKIKNLTPSQAHQLAQILKYGGSYEDIVKQISKYTNLNIDDIDKIFNTYAKTDQRFYEKFYKYRNITFTPYSENVALIRQTQALSNIAKNEMYNLFRTNVLGYTINGEFYNLRETYIKAIDKAVLNVSQGKENFDSAMSHILNDIGGSGLRTIDYASGRSVRLDSAVRMHLKGELRELHNENQKLIGEEFDYDGVEISVHSFPAIDHAPVQGRQFSKEEYAKLDAGDVATDVNGRAYTLDHDGKGGYRPISELNCYHYIFAIVLGVSNPTYSDSELQQIIDKNEKGFDFEGKHYSMYEGTQLQRQIETEIRKQKDIQILAKESDNKELIAKSQKKITQLTHKYKELADTSGLPTKTERMKVSEYKRTKVVYNNPKEIEYARKNNTIWHSTESLGDILETDKLISPSLSVGKELNTEVKYGTQFIEFKPEILDNVNKQTLLYKGDGGNAYTIEGGQFNNLMNMLKDNPKYYNELKFNNDLYSLRYIKRVYIRQDEPQYIIDLLKKHKIKYTIYTDLRPRGFTKKK